MGSNKIYYAIWVITICLSIQSSAFTFIHNRQDPVALDSYLHNYTHSSISKARTGVLHKVDLPTNFSGVEVSVVRLRSSRFWARGARFNPHFNIPPRTTTLPYVRRVEIMYESLGNWSSHYHNLPGYSFLAPVIGFAVYNGSLSQDNSNNMLNLTLLGKPITINFTNIVIPGLKKIPHKAKCVRFKPNGRVELSDMASEFVCSSRLEGHFTIAAPKTHHPQPTRQAWSHSRQRKIDIWKWWVIGFGAGLVGILILGVLGVFVCQLCLLRRFRWMEKKAEKSEALSTRWIGESRMPLAYMTRTQAMLENEYENEYDP